MSNLIGYGTVDWPQGGPLSVEARLAVARGELMPVPGGWSLYNVVTLAGQIAAMSGPNSYRFLLFCVQDEQALLTDKVFIRSVTERADAMH